MPSLNLDPGFPYHPKTLRLEKLLGPTASIYVVRLWCWAARFAPTSGAIPSDQVREALRFEPNSGAEHPGRVHKRMLQALNALEQCGFLKHTETGYEIHDWEDHAGHLTVYKQRAKEAAQARWNAHKPHASSIPAVANAPMLEAQKDGKSKNAPDRTGPAWTGPAVGPGAFPGFPSDEEIAAFHKTLGADFESQTTAYGYEIWFRQKFKCAPRVNPCHYVRPETSSVAEAKP